MDIRKFFQPKTSPAPAKKRKIEDDDDDDVIPESPNVQITNKKKKTNDPQKSSKSKPSKPTLKEVKTTDLFGNGPIIRTEPVVKKPAPKVPKNTETGIHSDDEFEKSLLEIDDLLTNGKEVTTEKDKPRPATSKDVSDKQNTEQCSSKEFDVKSSSNKEKEKLTPDSSSSNRETKNKDKKYKHSLSTIKPKTEHKNDKKSLKQEVSPAKVTKQMHLETKRIVDKLKKDIKDTNKRKFKEFIDSDINTDDVNKKTKIDKTDKANIIIDSADVKTNGYVIKSEAYDLTGDDSVTENEADQSISKKKRINKSLNESVLTDEERHERKIHSAALYQKYLNRTGPKHLGSKEMPEGAPNCMKDCAFLLTGVLDSFERDEVVETIKKYGGYVKSGISKKVTHVLAGDDAGPAKIAKAEELGIKILNEDEFLKIIENSNKATKYESRKDDKKNHKNKLTNGINKDDIKKEIIEVKKSANKKEKSDNNKVKDSHDIKRELKKESVSERTKDAKRTNIEKEKSDKNHANESSKSKSDDNKNDKTSFAKVNGVVNLENDSKSGSVSSSSSSINLANNVKPDTANCSMWVEKYKPQNLKSIIGQTGEASNVKKLINWLTKWYVNRKAKIPKPSPWAKNDDGGFYKAALLSGPPGVGKTTTVALVCKELGFDMVEFNASDTRNKTLIKEQIGELLTTTSLSAYAKGDTGKQAVTKKHVLVMDEVDGMAGNEDRGGLQELIGLIKTASVPIICMCNDRNSQKMRSLVNYCYDLRFNRPKVEQIKSAMRTICCKENIKVPPDVLGQLIVSANQDVRQTLNLLSMWAVDPTRMDADKLSKDATITKKDIKLGPWEAIRKVFSSEDHKKMSINDRSDLFFYDYSLSPLFVQENYLQVQPHCPKGDILDRMSKAAESIAIGDIIEKRIRSAQAWNLLPMQAMFSSVIPGQHLSGHMAGQIQFPGWLGKNSRKTKMHRLCQEIHAHTRLSTTGSKSSIFLDYATHLRDAILKPLIVDKADGIDRSLEVLESYHLLREDLESLTELSMWPGCKNPTVLVDPKVKAAMTRTYNKKATALPYAPGAIKRGKTREDDSETYDSNENDNENDDELDSDPENDALIKKKKIKETTEKPNTSKGKSSNGKGKSSSNKEKKK